MGVIYSTFSENCEKLTKALKKGRGNADQCEGLEVGNVNKEKYFNSYNNTPYNNFKNSYLPPRSDFNNKNILTSENFNNYLLTNSPNKSSDNDLNTFSTLGNKFLNHNANNSRNKDNFYTINNSNFNEQNTSYNAYFHNNRKNNYMNNFHTYPNDNIENSLNKKNNSNISNLTKSPVKCQLEDFIIIKLLGRGTFGKVLLVRNKKDFQLYAMKVLKKERLYKTNQILHTKTEREILEKINHPFIVKLHFAFQTKEKLYIVTEFMQGGELFFHLKKEHIFKENKVIIYVSEIVLAIEHLHKNKIIYRDLKPENILLDIDGHIKLADFGLSKFFNKNASETSSSTSENDNNSDKAFTLCGTPEYLAPEILIGKGYDKSVDWWSLGVLIYEMLCGCSPFKRRRDRKLSLNYYTTPVDFQPAPNISEDAKSLILSFLKNDPSERLSNINSIKSHPFFKCVNWQDIINKTLRPSYVPKTFLQGEEDLSCFDKNFTESEYSECEKTKGGIRNANAEGRTRGRKKKDEEFENFSFVRGDVGVTS